MRAMVVAVVSGFCAAFSLLAAPCQAAERKPPINVVFDTDVWADIDDMLALAMLHALHDRGELNLLAVTISTDDKWCASYVDLVDTFYGHSQTPVGIVHDGLTTERFAKVFHMPLPSPPYPELIARRKAGDGTLLYPHRLTDGSQAPEAVALLRKTLAAQPDNSVVMIQVGYSTNLARLLDSTADAASPLTGRNLVAKKVRWLSTMAGNFGELQLEGKPLPKGSPEFNLLGDIPAAQKVFASWPTPIVASGFEIGMALLYPGQSIAHDYAYVAHHPIADTYLAFCEKSVANGSKEACPHNHPTFDLTSVLYAARPDRDYFSLSKPGKITVLADGSTRFDELDGGAHRHLILDERQKARVVEAMAMLASQPPIHSSKP